MSETADRYRRVAGGFTTRVEGVPAGRWDSPSPCEDWTARDVVTHLVEWFPDFLDAAGGPVPPAGPDPATDPVGAWHRLDGHVQHLLDDPEISASTIHHPRAGDHRLDEAVAMFLLGDVLVHTWDLARATGQDDTLDPSAVHDMVVGIEPMADALAASGQYGPRVQVPDEADEQTRLLALTGRRARP